MTSTPPAPRPHGCLGALSIIVAGMAVSFPIAFAMQLVGALPLIMIITVPVALACGFPAFSILRKRARPSLKSIAKAGAVTGAAAPMAIALLASLQLLLGGASSSEGMVATALDMLSLIVGFAAAGITGAILTWGLIAWLSSDRLTPLARAGNIGLIVVLGAVALVQSRHLPDTYVDGSCHNPTRDGRASIQAVAGFYLRIPMRAWPTLSAQLKNFAADRRWSFRDTTAFDPAYPWFDASLCAQHGTLVETSYTPSSGDDIIVTISQPQGGDSWKEPAFALQRRLERQWPGSVSYRTDPSGEPAPPWPVERKAPNADGGTARAPNPASRTVR